MTQEKPRWIYRFDNYQRAYGLLREAIETAQLRPLSQLEKEGVIQRFEFTWELAWKVMKDYLQHNGTVFDTVTPASVIREAFAANLIADGDGWMEVLNTRNILSHSYDPAVFERTIKQIEAGYLSLFSSLYDFLLKKASSHA
jgi:nucleotidyltransferase substrate binding protein (TIGR01987 family)